MTLLDRSPERVPTTAPSNVPDMARRWYQAIAPNDGTLTTRALVKARGVAFVVALCALSALGGSQLADRTRPGVCVADQAGHCVVELTPHRDGEVTVRRMFPGEAVREAKVPYACLHPGDVPAGQCPDWLLNWQPPVGVG